MPYLSSKEKRLAKRHMVLYKKSIIIGSIFLIALIAIVYGNKCISTKVCGSTLVDQTVRDSVVIQTPNNKLNVELVDTKESRELGLSGRKSISDTDGMLFEFDYPGRYAFWMKDMTFPIDIVWITKGGVVAEVEKNVLPESYPNTYINDIEAKYVLELPVNKSVEYGLTLGAKVEINNQK